jgi:hypothetical protein
MSMQKCKETTNLSTFHLQISIVYFLQSSLNRCQCLTIGSPNSKDQKYTTSGRSGSYIRPVPRVSPQASQRSHTTSVHFRNNLARSTNSPQCRSNNPSINNSKLVPTISLSPSPPHRPPNTHVPSRPYRQSGSHLVGQISGDTWYSSNKVN